MRTVKRYTNTTFTHRVDHDGGRHRTPRAPAGPILCAGCGAVYENKHWTRSPNARLRASASHSANTMNETLRSAGVRAGTEKRL